MKKIFTIFIMSATLLLYGQLSHAGEYDDPHCFSVCDDNYKKCVADVINNPEPRTYVEQQTLDACQKIYGDCQHSCENSNKPQENQQEQKEGN
jgi:hypothetical protein